MAQAMTWAASVSPAAPAGTRAPRSRLTAIQAWPIPRPTSSSALPWRTGGRQHRPESSRDSAPQRPDWPPVVCSPVMTLPGWPAVQGRLVDALSPLFPWSYISIPGVCQPGGSCWAPARRPPSCSLRRGARRMSEADGARRRWSRSAVIRSASLEASWRCSSPSWMTARVAAYSADEAAGGVVERSPDFGDVLVEAGDLGRHVNSAALSGRGLSAGPWLWTMGGLNVKRPHCWPSRASKESQVRCPRTG